MTAQVPATEPSSPGTEIAKADRPNIAILQGFIGSLLILFGSFGVGWLSLDSAALRSNPLIIWMRFDQPIGAVAAVLMLATGGMLLVRSWLRLGQRMKGCWGPESRPVVLRAVIAWSAPMCVALPLFSRDVFAYIAQGLVMVSGLNPYKDGYSQISNYLQLGADDLWAQSPTPYGPVFLWIEELVVRITGGQPEFSILLFRLIALIGVALCVYYVPKLAELHGINPNRALWLTAANPLFLVNFIAAVHNDALMIGLALAGLYLAATNRALAGILLVTLSIGIKPITIIFLPFIGLLWAGKNASWRRKFVYWFMTAGISLGLLWIMGLINGFGFGWVGALSTPGSVWIWYAPVGFAGMLVATLGNALGLPGWTLADIVHTIGRVASVGIVLWQMFVGQYSRLIRRLALAFAAIVMLAPMIQSWYVVWLIPLFAVTGLRDDWQVKTLYLFVSFFMVYAISDQLDIWPYFEFSLSAARQIAAVIALGFALYLIFLDPKTKVLFRKKLTEPAPGELRTH
ncbi:MULTISPECIES: polyprenol phosphomannose-dependent alpha 1,6 mannosyltransferase MptB [unclassified Arthrobacter]|uniref:polyprenol phosphomannose-dependent alpha 1,6 mannosyltransferase MptB n=1 Tax=unclassified Arthrobacter TaxID=235627 RepID=UPI002104E6E5|nr:MULTISPECIES: polyprenol phosphomannose-dependent alpha 1,6 mannosyltransferase MptB [unclassified Arthrobacter]MCQ1947301.1 polyprenol phosphomannose-dependent alpha 1,6 mannosyltransferase MptB [Arthrobacter sp. zg-Y1116]MCQ1995213.1 polyprenol phosphomannose-dependent alpha 1,6 mannosyltransferase MptB [Arthrobacter sp. zg-Y1171]UWX80744.1 polyprenol phosphomannose-dependent alpha 1,6 mannosyltransferase MptB [Arthrobacter sp. zg-Y1171]